MMTQAGKKLNLKDHFCGTSQRNAVKLSAAADIEGHRFHTFCQALFYHFLSHKVYFTEDLTGSFIFWISLEPCPLLCPSQTSIITATYSTFSEGNLLGQIPNHFAQMPTQFVNSYHLLLSCSYPLSSRDSSRATEMQNIIILRLMKRLNSSTNKLFPSTLVAFIKYLFFIFFICSSSFLFFFNTFLFSRQLRVGSCLIWM